MQAAALSVGFCSERITFRRCVPPSAPLIPLFARIPRAVFNSAVPPLKKISDNGLGLHSFYFHVLPFNDAEEEKKSVMDAVLKGDVDL